VFTALYVHAAADTNSSRGIPRNRSWPRTCPATWSNVVSTAAQDTNASVPTPFPMSTLRGSPAHGYTPANSRSWTAQVRQVEALLDRADPQPHHRHRDLPVLLGAEHPDRVRVDQVAQYTVRPRP